MSVPICVRLDICAQPRYAYKMTQEQWRSVVGYEGAYEVSDLGRVRSLRRTVVDSIGKRRQFEEVMLKQHPIWSGYVHVTLWRDGRNKKFGVHRLVLAAFVGPCPPGMETRHGVGGKADNRLVNLCWGTKSENAIDKVRDGGNHHANKTHCVNGHAFNDENTYVRSDGGGRACKRCMYLRNRARVERQNPNRSVPNAQKTHCKQGHEYTDDNTYFSADGRRRRCKLCTRRSNSKSAERAKEPAC